MASVFFHLLWWIKKHCWHLNKVATGQIVSTNAPEGLRLLKSLGPQPFDYFFTIAQTSLFTKALNFDTISSYPAEDIPVKIINDYTDFLKEWRQYPQELNNLFFETLPDSATVTKTIEILGQLKNELSLNKSMVNRFNEQFVKFVHNKAQDMVNAYLNGDVAELEKRQYYYSGFPVYKILWNQMETASKLIPEQNYLSGILTIQGKYIHGLLERMAMETKPNDIVTLNHAIKLQQEALALDPYAPYINNEIGNLYIQAKKYDSAEYHLNLASVLSPTWAIPWSNKIKLYNTQNNLPKAEEAIEKAKSLQPELSYIKINAGLVKEKEKKLLSAEENYLQAIKQNNYHYLPYERLGYLYLQTGQFAKANYNFYEANKRKQGFAINDSIFSTGLEMATPPPPVYSNEYCLIETSENSNTLPFIKLDRGLRTQAYNEDISDSGLNLLAEAVEYNSELPLVYHYLGKKHFKQAKWQQAEKELLLAISMYRSKDELKKYLYDSTAIKDTSSTINCLAERLLDFQYDFLEDHYLLGKLYENQQLNGKAIKQYEFITAEENKRLFDNAGFAGYHVPNWSKADLMKVESDSEYLRKNFVNQFKTNPDLTGYLKLANLFEKQGEYDKAETVLLNQMQVTRKAADIRQEAIDNNKPRPVGFINSKYFWYSISNFAETATAGFYSRMLALNPLNPDPVWNEKAALFLYNRLALSFNQIPFSDQPLFYKALKEYAPDITYIREYVRRQFCESLPRYGYPWLYNWNEVNNDSAVKTFIPVTGELMRFKIPDFEPVTKALELIQQAIKLSGDVLLRRSLTEPLADLYYWTGNTEKAINIYANLTSRNSTDDTLRNKLVGALITNDRFTQVRDNLDTLLLQKKIRNDQIPKLANYQMLSDDFKKAGKTIKKFIPKNNADKKTVASFYGNMYWLKGNPSEALKYFLNSIPATQLKRNYYEEILPDENEEIYAAWYSTARTYAVLSQNEKAMKTLKILLDSGFKYNLVLENDKAWDSLKKTDQWQLLLSNYKLNIDYDIIKEDKINYSKWFKIPLKDYHLYKQDEYIHTEQ